MEPLKGCDLRSDNLEPCRPCDPCEEAVNRGHRLSGIEWLEKAAEEIGMDREIECDGPAPVVPLILAILLKHRDKACEPS